MIVELGGLGSSGIFHRPLVRSRKPVIMTWLCFKISTSNLVKMAMQSSPKSCPMEMREPVVISLKTWADCALGESLFEIFKVDRKLGLMTLPLSTWTVGSDVVSMIWEQCSRASR